MAGIRTSSGRGRQVQDISFHLTALRRRVGEISSEIRAMTAAYEQLQKDTAAHTSLQRRYDDCMSEVRGLEGELADYNLAMDKARTSVDPGEVARYQEELAARNAGASRDIDGIFVDRQEREGGIRRLEAQIGELQALAEARLSSLPPGQLEEYKRIVAGNSAMSDAVLARQEELEALNAQIAAAEAQLSHDVHREEVALLERKLDHLEREHGELSEELASSSLDPGAARAKLLAKVKSDNAAVQALDKELKSAQGALTAARVAARELRTDVEKRSADDGEGAKMEALFAKDQEMTQFIDSFPAARDKELGEHAHAQETVVALLEHIAGEAARQGALPTAAEAAALEGELKDKQTELQRSRATKERLTGELVQRKGELKRLETLEGKISLEIDSLTANMRSMAEGLGTLQDVEGLQTAADAAQEALAGQLTALTARADRLRHVTGDVAAQEEALASRLAHDATAASLEAQEARMKHYEQSIFTMREYIESQGRDADYSGVREEVLGLSHKLNGLVTKVQTTTAPSLSAAPY